MTARFDGDRLFEALRYLRDGTPGARVASQRQAERALLDEVPGAGRGGVQGAVDEAVYEEVCSTVCAERLSRRDFRGSSPGEAVEFIRACVRTRYLDALRAEDRYRRAREAADAGVAAAASVALTDDAGELASLERLVERVLEHAGDGRRHRASVWIDHRLGRPQPVGVDRGHPEFERRRDVLYQGRSTGRRYCAAIVDELRARGLLDDIEPEAVARLLSAPRGGRRPPGGANA